MDDVYPGAEVFGQPADQLHRVDLHRHRPRGEPGGVVPRVQPSAHRAVRPIIELRVYHQHGIQGGDGGKDGAQVGLGNLGKLFDTRRHQEALEAEDTGVVKGCDLGEIAGHQPAEEADVDGTPGRGGLALPCQRLDAHGRRDAVEGHVEEGGDSPGRRGLRGGGESLPLRPAGLVDVHVRVDEAGEDGQAPGFDDVGAGSQVVEGGDRGDPPSGNVNRGRSQGAGRHHPTAADHELDGRSGHGPAGDVSSQNRRSRLAETRRR
jgi:hypothetical protein